jgi:hypothetical protein
MYSDIVQYWLAAAVDSAEPSPCGAINLIDSVKLALIWDTLVLTIVDLYPDKFRTNGGTISGNEKILRRAISAFTMMWWARRCSRYRRKPHDKAPEGFSSGHAGRRHVVSRACCFFAESGFANRIGCDSRSVLGNEAGMDDTTLFGGPSGAGACAV